MNGSVRTRPLERADWPRVREIYEDGIASGHATFEVEAPGWDAWDRDHLPHSRLAGEADGRILGWAALSPVSDRCVYGGVAEVSVYVAEDGRGRGVGTTLLRELVAASEREGVWTLQAGIFPENEASLRMHATCGFRVVGRREKLGVLAGEWRDVLLLERRSETVGR